MNDIIDIFTQEPIIGEYQEVIKTKNYDLLINNTTNNHNYLLTYLSFLSQNTFVIYVASNIYKATTAYETLCQIAGFENVTFYVVDEVVSTELLAVSNEFKYERIHTINAILKNEKKIIVTHINALIRELVPKQVILDHILTFKEKDVIDINKTVQLLVEAGYRKAPVTSSIGEFSVRGELIDIFPINYNEPIRIDLFDNDIDYIKTFDPTTQKSNKRLSKAQVFPINELIYDHPDQIIEKIKQDCNGNISTIIHTDLDDIQNYNNLDKIHKYIKYFTNTTTCFLDYLDDKIVMYEEIKRIEESYQKMVFELSEYLENKPIPANLQVSYFLDYSNIFYHVDKKVYLSEFRQSLNNININKIIDLKGFSVIDYQNDVKNFINDIKANRKTFIITCTTNESMGLLYEIISENDLEVNKCQNIKEIMRNHINLIRIENAIGFGFIGSFEVINENNIFKKMKYKNTKYRSAYQNTTPINSKEDLKPGDFIVHYDYGIGQYLGIKTVELQDVKNDYIMLKFENMELYIPVENINLLEKYQGTEDNVPKLTSIGTNEWEKKKKKIREKLEDIARDLIKLQAIREEKQGYNYSEDDYIQKQFEEDFEFVETPDQLKTIDAIKQDMQNGLIVDRLVCGDVGYGKTEVAMRIALKTVLNGKQVAYLAPTTILTRQHYNNFKSRFEKYGIKVELLNRMVPLSKQEATIKQLHDGEVDIVIGTHKLLNERINYKELGLLIIDEEQRFGVTHKEKIKQYKNNVNVLTLTATPIPRTLQMSIMGVRQLSLIETPPQNRYPVQTYVLEENDAIIREAIYRELGRQGQVFFLHNRISDLDRVYRKLRRLVPDAKILEAHGQMEKNSLEDAIQSFIDKEYDVLLCTTIIETGIDIPNTNTLIVDMADRLGLAQMYQIRGRVGRSDRVSYAYFMFEEGKVLTDTGGKRLNAIKEFTTLGSGYKIAVRDLAIRGAGDILGREQSGFIDTIGLDMYMKMLNEAIETVKGNQIEKPVKKAWNVEISKHVSNNYVTDDDIKIYIHKQISKIETKEQKEQLINELTDRFGKINEEIELYIDKQYMESLFTKVGVDDIKEKDTFVTIILSQVTSESIDGAKLFHQAYNISSDINFEYKNKRIHIIFTKRLKDRTWIRKVIALLETFVYN